MSESKPAQVIRALTSDTRIRLAALDMRPLWDAVRRGHPHLESSACACLTQLLAGTLLLQSRSNFVERIQVMLRSSGRAKAIVADSWPDGAIRGVLDEAHPRTASDAGANGERGGLDRPGAADRTQSDRGCPTNEAHPRTASEEGANAPEAGDPEANEWFCPPGLLQVMRSTLHGEPTIGKLSLVEGDIAAQLEAYLQQSEQIQASVTLWCDPETGAGGGLLVEPLPSCPPERMDHLVAALEGLEVVPHWERDPEFLIRWINQGDGASILSTHDIEYRCRCGKESLLAVLASFSEEKLNEIFPGGESAEMRCDYCGNLYQLHREDVRRNEAQQGEA